MVTPAFRLVFHCTRCQQGNGTVSWFRVQDGKKVASDRRHTVPVLELVAAVGSGGAFVYSLGADAVRKWSVATQRFLFSYTNTGKRERAFDVVPSIALSGGRAFVPHGTGAMKIFDGRNGRFVAAIRLGELTSNDTNSSISDGPPSCSDGDVVFQPRNRAAAASAQGTKPAAGAAGAEADAGSGSDSSSSYSS